MFINENYGLHIFYIIIYSEEWLNNMNMFTAVQRYKHVDIFTKV